MKLYELAHRHPPTERLLGAALPEMQALGRNTGQSCHLAVHSHGEMLVIAQVDSTRNMGFAVHVGSKVGLTNSASGRVYLAFQDDLEQARLITTALRSADVSQGLGKLRPCDLAEQERVFLTSVQKVRRKGFVSMPSEAIRGITNLSYPVLGLAGNAVAALTVPHLQWEGEDGFPDLANIRLMLGEAASRISSAIGRIPA